MAKTSLDKDCPLKKGSYCRPDCGWYVKQLNGDGACVMIYIASHLGAK